MSRENLSKERFLEDKLNNIKQRAVTDAQEYLKRLLAANISLKTRPMASISVAENTTLTLLPFAWAQTMAMLPDNMTIQSLYQQSQAELGPWDEKEAGRYRKTFMQQIQMGSNPEEM